MTSSAADRRLMRLLAAILTGLWAVTAIIIAIAYRPGGAVDIAVALACFVPVAIADLGVIRPPAHFDARVRVILIWTWIIAALLVTSLMYGVATTLAADRPRALVPSFEAAYAGALALFVMAFFSVIGYVHRRLGERPLSNRGTVASALVAVVLTAVAGTAFLFVGFVNERDLRIEQASATRFGPLDEGVEPPLCDGDLRLGEHALVAIEAKSSIDFVDRGHARLEGRRSGRDESWGGSWEGPDGSGKQAYLRVGSQAWLNDESDDPHAPGTTWHESEPDPFDLFGATNLTMDGPPFAVANAPRGEIIAEDLGLEHVGGARARHCRTFIDGTTAMGAFLPLRWLLADSSTVGPDAIAQWRGEMDWWVFADGELGLVAIEVSGSRAETGWEAEGVRAVLEARLEAIDRTVPVDIAAPDGSDPRPAAATSSPRPAAATSEPRPTAALESASP